MKRHEVSKAENISGSSDLAGCRGQPPKEKRVSDPEGSYRNSALELEDGSREAKESSMYPGSVWGRILEQTLGELIDGQMSLSCHRRSALSLKACEEN